MTSNVGHIIKACRLALWIAPFYLLALLVKIYVTERPEFANSVHILALGIFFGALCILAILYQSGNEQNPPKQLEHLRSAIFLTCAVYGFCCLLSYAFSGQWTLLYL